MRILLCGVACILIVASLAGCQRLAMRPDQFDNALVTVNPRFTEAEMDLRLSSGECRKVDVSNITHTGLTLASETSTVAKRIDSELASMGANSFVVDHHMWIPHTWGTELSVDFTGYKCN